MIARLAVLLPYTVTLLEGGAYAIYGGSIDGYQYRFLPPARDPDAVPKPSPDAIKMNGKDAFEANVLRVDFVKTEFDRRSASPIDPPEDLIRSVVAEFQSRLRFNTRAAHARQISFPQCPWRLNYLNDDGSPLQEEAGLLRGRGSIAWSWSFIGLSPEIWDNVFSQTGHEMVNIWDDLRLDAQAAMPNVGPAIVLEASALEVFISVTLEKLSQKEGLSIELWKWITERGGRWLQQPSVEEQFDVLLKNFVGHSLKENARLWEAFKNLRSARNSFVHEGVARVGNVELSQMDAAKLLAAANEIFEAVRLWLPAEMQWPIPNIRVEMSWTHTIREANSESIKQPPSKGGG